jgi:hypothetical protein
MARKRPDTVKSATKGFQSILGRGELPAGTKTAGDLARDQSDPTRYGYQPPLQSPKRPTAPAAKSGGGAQPSRTRAPSPGLPKRAPLPPRRPSPGLTANPGMPGPGADQPWYKDRPMEPFPQLAGVPDVPNPMTTPGLRPEWGVGDAGFGQPQGTDLANLPPLPRTPNPMATMPSPQLSASALAGGLPTPSALGGGSAMAAPAGPPGGSPMTAGPTMGAGPPPLSNMPTMPGATPPLPPGLLDSIKQMFGGGR